MAQKAWYWLKRKLLPVPHVKVPTAASFTDVKAGIYAEQLTLEDAASFKRIDVSELTRSPFEAEQSPNTMQYTGRFHHLFDWTVRTILAQSCPKRRACIVSHFIQIAEVLHQLRNFHSEFAILSALCSTPVERLKVTWSLVPKSRRRTFSNLCELLSWQDNFKNLLELMDPKHGPCIPYIGFFLKDVYAAHPPHETLLLMLFMMEKVLSSMPFHQTVNFNHLRVWPNIQHLLEPCSEQDSKGLGSFNFMVSKELEP
ncbi:ras guanine nucleotide exchange factor C [Nephila pilipes]|uniref:Ras guanine nucleotide exchange factor C n=1 Tax=Nephila pilipes TaxID=299642 RepID=A0A8X6PMI9_NEPPI|nr:ras guanine nucleotide exchange factor C [Nephila pilipes]